MAAPAPTRARQLSVLAITSSRPLPPPRSRPPLLALFFFLVDTSLGSWLAAFLAEFFVFSCADNLGRPFAARVYGPGRCRGVSRKSFSGLGLGRAVPGEVFLD
jgi:hypothetical protein